MADNVFSVSSCRWVALGLILSITSVSLAEPGRSPGPIRWKAAEAGLLPPAPATTQPNAAEAGDAASLNSPAVVLAAKGKRHKVIQFDRIPTAGERTAMEAGGVKLLRYLGTNAFFASVQASPAAAATAQAAGAVFAQEVQKEHKLHPMLLRGEFPDYSKFKAPAVKGRLAVEPPSEKAHRLPAAVLNRKAVEPATSSDPHAAQSSAADVDTIALYVLFHPDIDLDTEAVDVIHKYGGVVRSVMRTINAAVIWIPQSSLDALAQDDAVQWLEPPLPKMKGANHQSRHAMMADDLLGGAYELDGSGVKILVYDAGEPLASHAGFGGRVHVHDAHDPPSPENHATAICGSIAGDGRTGSEYCPDYRGIAPAAELECYHFDPSYSFKMPGFVFTDPGDLEGDYQEGVSLYSTILGNNSVSSNVANWGFPCEWQGDYGLTSMLIDGIVVGTLGSPMRVVSASGNGRNAYCGAYYKTITPPAGAKNHISVGATFNSTTEGTTPYSSWGPTDDGRLTPTVCAPGSHPWRDTGYGIFSTSAGGEWCWYLEGTSFSSAFVAGVCALVLQDFKSLYPTTPLLRNSTLKALLCHTARDIASEGPDYESGYGVVLARPAIDHLRSGDFLEDSISQGEERLFYASAPVDSNDLRVTMAWDDPTAALNAATQLVNDLDIVAIAPNGDTYYPWTLDPNNPANSAVRTQADHINNIEQIVVNSPEPGLWTIRVRGYSVPEGPQVFSLAFTPNMSKSSKTGRVVLDAESYNCSAQVNASVIDSDLNTNPAAIDTITQLITSTSEPAGETVVLSETGASTGVFTGTIQLSPTNAQGVLWVQNGDTIGAIYTDAEDANGQVAVVQDSATVDCVGPVISGIAIQVEGYSPPIVTFVTDQPAVGTVRYGLSCGSLSGMASTKTWQTSHSVELRDIEPNTTCFLAIDARDVAGNVSTDSNDGCCYSFTTQWGREDCFTAWFIGRHINGKDQYDYHSITFIPDGSNNFYSACVEPITNLPTDPNYGHFLDMSYDRSVPVVLDFHKVWLYGQPYGDRRRPIYIGNNGYLTFTSGDAEPHASLENHFRLPRVSGFYDNLCMGAPGCSVSWRQTEDRLAVTWINMYEYRNPATLCTFQIEMFYDGRIRLSYLQVYSFAAIMGLSEGLGLPSNYVPSDVSTYSEGPCPDHSPSLGVSIQGLGSVTVDPNDPNWPAQAYPFGRKISLRAEPNSDNHFVRWEVADPNHPDDANVFLIDLSNPLVMVMYSDRQVRAVFADGVRRCGEGTVELVPLMTIGLTLIGIVARRSRGKR